MSKTRRNALNTRPWAGIEANERAFHRVRNALVDIILYGTTDETPGYLEKGQATLADFVSQHPAPRGRARSWMEIKTNELRRLVTQAHEVAEGIRPPKMPRENPRAKKAAKVPPKPEPRHVDRFRESWAAPAASTSATRRDEIEEPREPRHVDRFRESWAAPEKRGIQIEYGAVRNKRGPGYGWLPVIWAYGRERGDTYATGGFEEAEAIERARADAIDFAKGDPDATISPRKAPHENPRAKKAAKVPKTRRTRAATKPQDRARARRAAKRPLPPRARRARRARALEAGPPLELARKTTTHVYTVRKENPAHRSDLYNGRRRVGAGPVVNLRPNPTPLELRPRWMPLRTGGKMSERARELTRGQTGVYAIREAAGGPILYIGEAHEAHPTELRRPKRKKGQRTRPPAVRRPQPLRWWKTITRHLYPWEWHYDPRDPRSEHNKRPDEWVYRGNHDLEISIWPTTPGQAKTTEGRLILEHRPKHSRKLELPAAEVDELEAAGELEEAPF